MKCRAAGPMCTCLERTMTVTASSSSTGRLVPPWERKKKNEEANHFARILSNQFFMEMEKER